MPAILLAQTNDLTELQPQIVIGGFVTLAEARTYLDAKAASHEEQGWTVTRLLDEVRASKVYPSPPVGQIGRKDRVFTIRL